MLAKMRQIFFTGLFTLLPILVTFYILFFGLSVAEGLFSNFLRDVLTEKYYVPGLGLLLSFTTVFLFGLLLNNYLTKGLLTSLERRVTQIPLIKAVYSPLKDLMNLFSQKGSKGMKSVVLIEINDSGTQAMGLLTRESFRDLSELSNELPNHVAVYIPMSYGLGGFTLLVPRNKIKPIDIPIEKAMSLAITGWVKAETEVKNG